jgi:hypothetical protein
LLPELPAGPSLPLVPVHPLLPELPGLPTPALPVTVPVLTPNGVVNVPLELKVWHPAGAIVLRIAVLKATGIVYLFY